MKIDDLIKTLPERGCCDLAPPPFISVEGNFERIGLAVKSMAKHMTDEGWQLFQGLESAGYTLCGHGIETKLDFQAFCETYYYDDLTNVAEILEHACPKTVVVQDKREWTGMTAGPGFDQRERFRNVEALAARPDVFKVGVLKDAQGDGAMHRNSAEEMGTHAWIVYYNPKIVKRLAPYVRERHLIRTWHSVDRELVPPFSKDRDGWNVALLSGAISRAYPLRSKIALESLRGGLPNVIVLAHPGYRRDGCRTPDFLSLLSEYKVAICTSSVYGYALRKLIEATACGCRVITNLPEDEVLPLINDNLVRVDSNITVERLRTLIDHHLERWDEDFQREMAKRACDWYDFRATGKRLAADIEAMRRSYDASVS